MSDSTRPPMSLGNLQILVGALIAGVVALTLVAVFVSPPGAMSFDLDDERTVWLGVVIALLVGAVVMVLVLSRVLAGRSASNARSETWTDEELLADFATYTVVRCALAEGVGFLGATVYLIAGLGFGLVVVVASLLALAAFYPTTTRLVGFEDLVTRPE